MQWKVRVEIPVRKTEDESIILSLIEKIMVPDEIKIEEAGEDRIVVATSRCVSSLEKLHSFFRRERILDAARKRIKKISRRDKVVILLNKQTLAVNRLSLVDDPSESPLGPVKIEVIHDDINKIIDWLVPPTRKGRPIKEYSLPENECVEE